MFNAKTNKKITTAIIALMIASLFQDSFAYVPKNVELKDEKNYESILNLNSAHPYSGSTLKLKSSTTIKNPNLKINISLRDSDVKQVFRMFADKAKMNIIFHSSAEGKVTLDLVNTTLSEAFLFVLETCELNYYIQDNTIVVFSASAANAAGFTKQVLSTIPIKYVSANSVVEFLNDNVFSSNLAGISGSKIATSNPRTNEVLIFGTPNDVDIARKVIAKVDTKPMMNTFKVAHTTPKQMADLICKTLFSEGGSAASGEDAQDTDSDVIEMSLGGGSIACTASSEATGENASVFKAQVASIVYLEQLGEVGIYGGSYEQAELIRDFIAKHDRKQPMAFIELNIVELNETGSNEFNNKWDVITPFATFGFDEDKGLSMGTINVLSATSAGWSMFQTNPGGIDAKATITWLVKDGKGRTLSNPKILATNGQATTIDLTSDYVKTVTTQYQSVQQTGSTSESTANVTKDYEVADDNGLKIDLTTFISPAGYVALDIAPEFATIKQQIYSKPEDPVTKTNSDSDLVATLLQRRNLELKNIRIKDGETLVLAGFIQEFETQTATKVPFLGDLPIVGVLFRSSKTSKTKEELVIMITPHIVYTEEDVERVKNVEKI